MKELEAMRSAYATTLSAKEKKLVHYSVEMVKHDVMTGKKTSHPEIVKTGVKLFADVKKNLELQGYTVIILWHPENKYNTPMFVETKDEALVGEVAEAKAKVAEKDEEIARLKAELALAKAKVAEKKEPKTDGKKGGKGGKKAEEKEVESKVEEK